MQIYIHIEGEVRGPYESLSGLPLTPDTPVWYEGLADWTPAGAAPLTAALFTQQPPMEGTRQQPPFGQPPCSPQPGQWSAPGVQGWQQPPTQTPAGAGQDNPAGPQAGAQPGPQYNGPQYNGQPYGGQQYGGQPYGGQPGWGYNPQTPPPSSYLGWAIAVTILCCLPFGVVAIIYASQVNNKWRMGDMQGAYKSSKNAQAWIIASVVAGLVWGVLYTMTVGFAGMAGL